jgi:hypothetical protein
MSWRDDEPTSKQVSLLSRLGCDSPPKSKGAAKDLISSLIASARSQVIMDKLDSQRAADDYWQRKEVASSEATARYRQENNIPPCGGSPYGHSECPYCYDSDEF